MQTFVVTERNTNTMCDCAVGFKLNKNKSFALQYAQPKHNTNSTDVSETTKQYGKYVYLSGTKLYTSVYFAINIDILVKCNSVDTRWQ